MGELTRLSRFEEHARIVREHRQGAEQFVTSLRIIRDEKLYKDAGYESFDVCVLKEFDISKQWAYKVLAADSARSQPRLTSPTVNEMSTKAAAELSRVPEPKRAEVVEAVKDNPTAPAVRQAAQRIEKEEPIQDALGGDVPKELRPIFEGVVEIKELMIECSRMKTEVAALADKPFGRGLKQSLQEIHRMITDLRATIRFSVPHCIAPGGKFADLCKGKKWLTEGEYNNLVKYHGGK